MIAAMTLHLLFIHCKNLHGWILTDLLSYICRICRTWPASF